MANVIGAVRQDAGFARRRPFRPRRPQPRRHHRPPGKQVAAWRTTRTPDPLLPPDRRQSHLTRPTCRRQRLTLKAPLKIDNRFVTCDQATPRKSSVGDQMPSRWVVRARTRSAAGHRPSGRPHASKSHSRHNQPLGGAFPRARSSSFRSTSCPVSASASRISERRSRSESPPSASSKRYGAT
jgi:hypothetical protein